MEKAFEELVEILWRYGNAGQIPCSIILLINGDVVRASTVGVLGINNLDPKAFLDRARDREEFQSSAPIPFSLEVEVAVANLVTSMHDKQYALIVMHPSSSIEDIVVCAGERINGVCDQTVSGWGFGIVALSARKMPKSIEYVVPKQHQKAA